MAFLFNSFLDWKAYSVAHSMELYDVVLEYEQDHKGQSAEEIMKGILRAYQVMCDAVKTGLNEEMKSRSGMINDGAKKVFQSPITVLSPEFQKLVARALAAKEVNSCMGRIVAAPTAGASGILPGTLVTLQEIHQLPDSVMVNALLLSAGIALIIQEKASLAGAVGGCQAETGSAAAMAAGAITFALGGTVDQQFNAVGITIQCMLGLVCDPVAGLVEVPCVVRNASAAAIANASAQMALAGLDPVIPVDQCVEAMGEIGQSMETRYKETALGGLAATRTGQEIAKKVLIQDIDILPDED